MLEKIRTVSNPLTIIAIFAALAEVAGTIALATVNRELQQVFVWFVMGFPILLVVLFFATLNFNAKVLYAPSDFRDEENFLNTLVGSRVSIGLGEVTRQLGEAKDRILRQAVEDITHVGGAERSKLSEILDRQLKQIETRIESVRQTAEALASGVSEAAYPQSGLQARIRILQLLREGPVPMRLLDVVGHMGMSRNAAARVLQRLVEERLVVRKKDGGEDFYTLAATTSAGDNTSSA
jgi:DNA-binding transcriptional ArsR family regulator